MNARFLLFISHGPNGQHHFSNQKAIHVLHTASAEALNAKKSSANALQIHHARIKCNELGIIRLNATKVKGQFGRRTPLARTTLAASRPSR